MHEEFLDEKKRAIIPSSLAARAALVIVLSASGRALAGTPTTVFVVDAAAPGGGDGMSWATAFNDLQTALDAADLSSTRKTVWVKAGTYTPVTPSSSPSLSDRRESFDLPRDVTLLGSFDGTEQAFGDRDFEPGDEPTSILSGAIDTSNNELHSFHVLTSTDPDIDQSDIIEGFYIQDGRADGTGTDEDEGAGAFFDVTVLETSGDPVIPTFSGCRFKDNESNGKGAAVYAESLDGNLADCQFYDNDAGNDGGAISVGTLGGLDRDGNAQDGQARRCTFDDNSTSASGGAIDLVAGADIYECKFRNNMADDDGGGIYTRFGDLDVVSCIFAGNASGAGSEGGGGAIGACSAGSNADDGIGLTNCLIVGNSCEGASALDECAAAICARRFELVNCTIADNSTTHASGAAIWSFPTITASTVDNCVVYFNTAGEDDGLAAQIISATGITIEHSCVVDITETNGNIDDDPEFFAFTPGSPHLSEFRLAGTSPCIDAGDDALLPNDIADLDGDGNTIEALPLDLDGRIRVQDDVEMGAFEGEAETCDEDLNGDSNVNTEDLLVLLGEWGCTSGSIPCPCVAELTGNCDVDTQDLLALLAAWGDCGQTSTGTPETVQDCYDLYSSDVVKLEACIDAIELLQGG